MTVGHRLRRRLLTWMGLLVGLSMCFAGWQAIAQDAPPDDGLARYRAGAKTYVEACGSCHIALPPEVLPAETWRQLLSDSNHYGITIETLQGPFRQIAWTYLRDFSRNLLETETVPYRIERSRYFKALHPDVTFENPVTVGSCVSCHPQADVGNFIALSEAWR
ncbi:MAG: hypothetical protein AAGB13_19380 [Cyanobacteria bacterium P01_F01_bin.33]